MAEAASRSDAPRTIRWGVLGAAKIALEYVIPATNATPGAQVVALASRSTERGRAAADRFGIPRVYQSYQALLEDPDIDVVYNPLPNHLHVPWSIKALEAGKHVLCEKPLALNAHEAVRLLEARDRTGLLAQEAVMVRTHPRWLGARDLVRSGAIGELRAVTGFFAYRNLAPENYRNTAGMGGGGLLDVGFYPITMARFLFETEPTRVMGLCDLDPVFGTDRLTSAILEFPRGQATFICSTQMADHQALDIHGTHGRIGVEIPWSMPADRPSRLLLDDGQSLTKDTVQAIPFPACDQWQVQCQRFCQAIRDGGPAPVPLEDAVANMRVLDAVALAARTGRWVSPCETG